MIDFDFLERQTLGDAGLRDELLALFVEQIDRQALALADGGAGAQRDAAHTLRGAALAVGALDLAEAAGEAERLAERQALGPDRVAALIEAASAAKAAALVALDRPAES